MSGNLGSSRFGSAQRFYSNPVTTQSIGFSPITGNARAGYSTDISIIGRAEFTEDRLFKKDDFAVNYISLGNFSSYFQVIQSMLTTLQTQSEENLAISRSNQTAIFDISRRTDTTLARLAVIEDDLVEIKQALHIYPYDSEESTPQSVPTVFKPQVIETTSLEDIEKKNCK